MKKAGLHFKNRFGRAYGGNLCIDSLKLAELAERFGTPLYVYSLTQIEECYKLLNKQLDSSRIHIHFAVKANASLALLQKLHLLGSRFDVVSDGEFARLRILGIDGSRVVFSGVGKREQEIENALRYQIASLHVESEEELMRIEKIAKRMGLVAPVAIRIATDTDAQSHEFLTTGMSGGKFGVQPELGLELVHHASKSKHLQWLGLSSHIGSQVNSLEQYMGSAYVLENLFARISKSIKQPARLVDVGGGFKYDYQQQVVDFDFVRYGRELLKLFPEQLIMIEPGRSLVAHSGVLISRIEYIKQSAGNLIAIVDAGMNDLLRVALYQAQHKIEAVVAGSQLKRKFDIAGPICESSDFFAHDVALSCKAGDLLAIRDVGAYGQVMASNYNMRARAAEVCVEGQSAFLSKERENVELACVAEADLLATHKDTNHT